MVILFNMAHILVLIVSMFIYNMMRLLIEQNKDYRKTNNFSIDNSVVSNQTSNHQVPRNSYLTSKIGLRN